MSDQLPGRLADGEVRPLPRTLAERLQFADCDATERITAKLIAGHLGGLAPATLTAEERGYLDQYGPENTDRALQLLEQIGYGPDLYRDRKPARTRAHGLERERRIQDVLGKLPRALALRMPTSADTHRSGPNDGTDRWGKVRCSHTLRPSHLGLTAALCGLWTKRTPGEQAWIGCTAGELAQLLYGRTRHGGRDIVNIHQLLTDLEQLQLTAAVTGNDNDAYEIPSTPVVHVERRIGNRWVTAGDYAQAILEDSQAGHAGQIDVESDEILGTCETIRVHLAEWVRDALTAKKRRTVFLDLDVWAHLRPQGSRLYAFLQGQGRDRFDNSLYFYLGAPTLYTLGLRDRIDRSAASVSFDLAAIVKADRRYDRFRRHTHANTKIPAFGVHALQRKSEATELAKQFKAAPKRSQQLRELERLSRAALRPLTPEDGASTIKTFRDIAGQLSQPPAPPLRPRRSVIRRQLVYAPPDTPAAAAA